jgi:hypothetical protein
MQKALKIGAKIKQPLDYELCVKIVVKIVELVRISRSK